MIINTQYETEPKNTKSSESNIDTKLINYSSLINNVNKVRNSCLTIKNPQENINVSINNFDLSYQFMRSRLDSCMATSIFRNNKNKEKNKLKMVYDKCYHETDNEIKSWWEEEKTAFISSLINRQIDKVCREKQLVINKDSKKTIFDKIQKNSFVLDKIKLDHVVAQSSIIHNIINNPKIVEKIDSLNISTPTSLLPLEETINPKDNIQYLTYFYPSSDSKIPESFHISAIKSNIYYLLAENIYNALLDNDSKIDFDAIKKDIEKLISCDQTVKKLLEPQLGSAYFTKYILSIETVSNQQVAPS